MSKRYIPPVGSADRSEEADDCTLSRPRSSSTPPPQCGCDYCMNGLDHPPRTFAEKMSDRAGVDAHARNHASPPPPSTPPEPPDMWTDYGSFPRESATPSSPETPQVPRITSVNQSGVTLDYSRAPETLPELEEALKEFQIASAEWAVAGVTGKDRSVARTLAARSALLALYTKLQAKAEGK